MAQAKHRSEGRTSIFRPKIWAKIWALGQGYAKPQVWWRSHEWHSKIWSRSHLSRKQRTAHRLKERDPL